jgi:hypothetical protein
MRAATAVVTDTAHPSGRHRSTRSRSVSLLAGLSFALVLVTVAAAVLLAGHYPGSAKGAGSRPAAAPVTPLAASPAATTMATDVTAQLAWVRANLSRAAVIVTDPAAASTLHAGGFTAATSYADSQARALPTLDYVMWNPGTELTPPVSRLLAASLPLAIFGAGSDAPAVRQVFSSGLAAARSAQAKDAALRTSSGAQLTQNPRLTIDAPSTAILRSGGLDLRAQNVSNVLATGGPIWLSIAAAAPAEQLAGLPDRSITVTAQDPAAMQVTLASLTPPYRPVIVSIAPNKVRLSWPPQIAPVGIAGD